MRKYGLFKIKYMSERQMKRPKGRVTALKKQDECWKEPASSAPSLTHQIYIRVTFKMKMKYRKFLTFKTKLQSYAC